MKRLSVIIVFCLLSVSVVLAGKKKMYELDESINLDDLRDKLELFKKTREVISKNINGLMLVHKSYKKSNLKLIGQMMVKVILNSEGEVKKIKIMSSEIRDKMFKEDVKEYVSSWKFGKMKKDRQEILIPFYFK